MLRSSPLEQQTRWTGTFIRASMIEAEAWRITRVTAPRGRADRSCSGTYWGLNGRIRRAGPEVSGRRDAAVSRASEALRRSH
jgi:hypothetical protein